MNRETRLDLLDPATSMTSSTLLVVSRYTFSFHLARRSIQFNQKGKKTCLTCAFLDNLNSSHDQRGKGGSSKLKEATQDLSKILPPSLQPQTSSIISLTHVPHHRSIPYQQQQYLSRYTLWLAPSFYKGRLSLIWKDISLSCKLCRIRKYQPRRGICSLCIMQGPK